MCLSATCACSVAPAKVLGRSKYWGPCYRMEMQMELLGPAWPSPGCAGSWGGNQCKGTLHLMCPFASLTLLVVSRWSRKSLDSVHSPRANPESTAHPLGPHRVAHPLRASASSWGEGGSDPDRVPAAHCGALVWLRPPLPAPAWGLLGRPGVG